MKIRGFIKCTKNALKKKKMHDMIAFRNFASVILLSAFLMLNRLINVDLPDSFAYIVFQYDFVYL